MSNFVSVVIPCFNEEKFIVSLIENLKKQDYPIHLIEYLIIDGISNDNTRKLIEENIVGFNNMKMYDNPEKTQPYAMNLGIGVSKGDIILRMDVHCHYPNNYVSELVRHLTELCADNVGGIWVNKPSSLSRRAVAISLATSSSFCVGNAQYRTSNKNEPYVVDTVPFGCFRKSLFSKIGLFDTSLPRGEDDEFNARIKKNGGKILLVPSIQIEYYTRDAFSKISKMFYQYGLYKPLTNKKNGKVTTFRQLVPFLFVCYLAVFLPANIIFNTPIFALPLILYLAISLFMSLKIKYNIFLLIMYVFFISHISYGVGYIIGIIKHLLFQKNSEQIEISR